MAEMNAGLQKLLHADFSHRILFLPLGPVRGNLELISGWGVLEKRPKVLATVLIRG